MNLAEDAWAPCPWRGGARQALTPVCLSSQYYFTVLFGHEGQKPLELRCEEEQDGKEWMEAIHQARWAGPWGVLESSRGGVLQGARALAELGSRSSSR